MSTGYTSYPSSVAPVIAAPTSSSQAGQPLASGVYTHGQIEARYVINQNRVQLPYAEKSPSQSESPNTCVVAKIGQPFCRLIVTVDFERTGGPPNLPAPIDVYQDPNTPTLEGALLKQILSPQAPVPTPDQLNFIYRTHCVYIYAMNRVPLPTEAIDVGYLPFTIPPGGENYAFNGQTVYA
jgi:hypothetical protein